MRFPPIELRYRTFIPSPALIAPTGHIIRNPLKIGPPLIPEMKAFSGDNRRFEAQGGTHRTAMKLIYSHDERDSNKILKSYFACGETKQYDLSDVHQVQSKPKWFFDISPHATPKCRTKLSVTRDTFKVKLKDFGTVRRLELRLCAKIPLIPHAPAIDSHFYIHIKEVNGRLEFKIDGQHDEFPSHEIYINRRLIYGFDAMQNPVGPLSLIGDTKEVHQGYRVVQAIRRI